MCPYYMKWHGMLQRCHSVAYIKKKKNPTYKDCWACDEWLLFSNFKAWMRAQEWEGKHIDKDLLITGNKKKYSPETSYFNFNLTIKQALTSILPTSEYILYMLIRYRHLINPYLLLRTQSLNHLHLKSTFI